MITITINPKKYTLKIKGHADYAEYGKDIICASVSMVFYNLCQMILEYDKDKAFYKREMQYTSGKAELKVVPRSGYEIWLDHDFLYALSGFKLLEARYPEYVVLKVTEV